MLCYKHFNWLATVFAAAGKYIRSAASACPHLGHFIQICSLYNILKLQQKIVPKCLAQMVKDNLNSLTIIQ